MGVPFEGFAVCAEGSGEAPFRLARFAAGSEPR
jgi:hypothetical protein